MILIDTNPLVALCDSRDPHHARAVADFRKLARQEFVTCESVLVEATFHLPGAAQRKRLQALLTELNVKLIPPALDVAICDAIFSWLARYSVHSPDWADGCIAVMCGLDRKIRVWTYDGEFQKIWRRPDGTAIPLAIRAS